MTVVVGHTEHERRSHRVFLVKPGGGIGLLDATVSEGISWGCCGAHAFISLTTHRIGIQYPDGRTYNLVNPTKEA